MKTLASTPHKIEFSLHANADANIKESLDSKTSQAIKNSLKRMRSTQ